MTERSVEPKHGEWYWGAKCPTCGEMAAHVHDPSGGEDDDHGIDATHVEMQCPKGHRFSHRSENLLNFEWGAQ
jgi:hypothetical protein